MILLKKEAARKLRRTGRSIPGPCVWTMVSRSLSVCTTDAYHPTSQGTSPLQRLESSKMALRLSANGFCLLRTGKKCRVGIRAIRCKLDTSHGSREGHDDVIRCTSIRRREAAILVPVLLAPMLGLSPPAQASDSSRGLGRYIRKKKLDPLETYVPVCLIARCVYNTEDNVAKSLIKYRYIRWELTYEMSVVGGASQGVLDMPFVIILDTLGAVNRSCYLPS